MTPTPRLACASATVVALVFGGAPEPLELRAAGPSAKDVIARARAYVDSYRVALSTLVAEERYTQRAPGSTRTLVSDFAVVRADDGMWVGFRDVWEVDGRELPDRQARAERLFGAGRLDWTSARRIIEESARFNLGPLGRDVNTPIVALELVSSARSRCCRARARRAPGADGAGLWVIDLEEKTTPTLIRTVEGRPVYARAQYLVEPDTGVIRRTELRIGKPETVRITLRVDFARDEALGQWLPDDMTEAVGTPDARSESLIEGRARYVRWRRFQATSRILGCFTSEDSSRHRSRYPTAS